MIPQRINDFWMFNPQTGWTQLHPLDFSYPFDSPTYPPVLYSSMYDIDPLTGNFVLFGGETDGMHNNAIRILYSPPQPTTGTTATTATTGTTGTTGTTATTATTGTTGTTGTVTTTGTTGTPTTCPLDSSPSGTDVLDASTSGTWDHVSGQYVEITLVVDGILQLSTCGQASFDTEILLATADGLEVGFNDDFCGLQSQLTRSLTAGVYRIYIYRFHCVASSPTPIAFTWQSGATGTTGSPVLACPLDASSPSAMYGLDASTSGTWDNVPGQYIEITLVADGTIDISTCDQASYDTEILVATTDGLQVGFNDDSCGLQSRVSLTLSPGVYRVYLYTYSCAASAPTSITFNWQRSSASGTPTTQGTALPTTGSETTGSETTGSETTGSETTGSESSGSESSGSESSGSETTGSETTGSESSGSETTGSESSGFGTTGSETEFSDSTVLRSTLLFVFLSLSLMIFQ